MHVITKKQLISGYDRLTSQKNMLYYNYDNHNNHDNHDNLKQIKAGFL